MREAGKANALPALICYHYWFAFHADTNDPFTKKFQFELAHQEAKSRKKMQSLFLKINNNLIYVMQIYVFVDSFKENFLGERTFKVN